MQLKALPLVREFARPIDCRPGVVVVFLSLLTLGSGCAHRKNFVLNETYKPATRLAILPFDNASTDLEASSVARDLVRINLTRKGYALKDFSEIDRILKNKFAISDGGQLRSTTPQKLGAALGADGLVYGSVEEFMLVPAGAYNQRSAEVELKFVRSQDAGEIFTCTGKAAKRSVETNVSDMLRETATAVGEKVLTPLLGHPVRPIGAAAVNKCLRKLPPTQNGMPDFGGRTIDEIGLKERCVLLIEINPAYGVWVHTEVDPFTASPVCYSPTRIAEIDRFLDATSIFIAKVRLAATIAYFKKMGRTTLPGGRSMEQEEDRAREILQSAIADFPNLVSKGKTVIQQVPALLKGTKAFAILKVVRALKQTIQNLLPVGAQAKAAISGLSSPPPQASASAWKGFDSTSEPSTSPSKKEAGMKSFAKHSYRAAYLMEKRDWDEASKEWIFAAAGLDARSPLRLHIAERMGVVSLAKENPVMAKKLYTRAISFAQTEKLVNKDLVMSYLGLTYCQVLEKRNRNALQNFMKAEQIAVGLLKDEAEKKRQSLRLGSGEGKANAPRRMASWVEKQKAFFSPQRKKPAETVNPALARGTQPTQIPVRRRAKTPQPIVKELPIGPEGFYVVD